jgi:hypothetical protein
LPWWPSQSTEEIAVGKDEIAQMAAQMLAEMPNASEQVAVALGRELRERALERAGRECLSEAIRARHRRAHKRERGV